MDKWVLQNGKRSGDALACPLSSCMSDPKMKQEVDDAATAVSTSIFSGSYCPSVAANTATTSHYTSRTVATGVTDHENGGVKHTHMSGITDAALQHFHDAMSLIDSDKKEGWTRAQAKCPPAVLRHECCPCYFLRACRLNPWDAAVRMCSYWKERIDLFEDRAFEAMTLGSESVPPTGLTEADVKLFETGTFIILPRDRSGRTVMFVDEAELEAHMRDQPASRLRVLWYVLHASIASGGENAHRLVVLYACYRPPSGGQYSASTLQFSTGAVKCPQVLPIVMDSIHLLTLQPKTGTGALINVIIAAAAVMLGSYLSSLTHVHHGTTKRRAYANALEEETHAKKSLLWQLLDIGFTGKGLPYWAGGSFEYQDFVGWARRRQRFEQKAFWTAAERMHQRRDVNKAHSREKRRRRHEELDDLQEEATKLRLENERAKAINTHLEQLVEMAVGAVTEAQAVPQPAVPPTREPTTLPELSLDPFHPLNLEHVPVAPTHMNSIPVSAGPPVSSLPDPPETQQLSGGIKPQSDQGTSFPSGTTEATFHHVAFTECFCPYSPGQPPLEFENTPSNFTWNFQSSRSGTGKSTTMQPSDLSLGVAPPVLDRTVTADAGIALPSSVSECRNVSRLVASPSCDVPAECPTQPRSDRAVPTGTNLADALLLRAIFQHQRHPHTDSEVNTVPLETGRQGFCHVGSFDPDDHLRPQAQSKSWQFPSPTGGEHGRAEAWSENSAADHSITDDRRADLSMLFDLDRA